MGTSSASLTQGFAPVSNHSRTKKLGQDTKTKKQNVLYPLTKFLVGHKFLANDAVITRY